MSALRASNAVCTHWVPVDSSTDQFGDDDSETRQDDSVNNWDDSATR